MYNFEITISKILTCQDEHFYLIKAKESPLVIYSGYLNILSKLWLLYSFAKLILILEEWIVPTLLSGYLTKFLTLNKSLKVYGS